MQLKDLVLTTTFTDDTATKIKSLLVSISDSDNKNTSNPPSQIISWWQDYLKGNFYNPSINYALTGLSDFNKQILQTLLTIPAGTTISYSDLALKAGFSKYHARAVGTVMKRNPYPILIPCHRVLPASGKLGFYSCISVDLKKLLLEHEGIKMV